METNHRYSKFRFSAIFLKLFAVVGILRHFWRHQAPTTPSMTSISAVSSSYSLAVTGTRGRSRRAEKKRQAGRTLVIVVVMFAVLWLPVHIHLLVMAFGKVPDTRFYEVKPFHKRFACVTVIGSGAVGCVPLLFAVNF